MRTVRQRLIVIGIWVIALVETAWEGWGVPSHFRNVPQGPVYTLRDWTSFKTFSWDIVWFGLFGPVILFLVYRWVRWLFPPRRRRTIGRVRAWVDQRWGEGTMAFWTDRLRWKDLMVIAGVVYGVSALLACEYQNGSFLAFHAAAFLLAAGIGVAITYLMAGYLDTGRTNV